MHEVMGLAAKAHGPSCLTRGMESASVSPSCVGGGWGEGRGSLGWREKRQRRAAGGCSGAQSGVGKGGQPLYRAPGPLATPPGSLSAPPDRPAQPPGLRHEEVSLHGRGAAFHGATAPDRRGSGPNRSAACSQSDPGECASWPQTGRA